MEAVRRYTIERSSMEWNAILRYLSTPHHENAMVLDPLIADIELMLQYDDQHTFPDQPQIELPERVKPA